MTLFRPHRGSLDKAMAEVITVDSIDDIVDYAKKQLAPWGWRSEISRDTIRVEKYCYDKRIEWDTYIVVLEGLGVLGFTNGQLE